MMALPSLKLRRAASRKGPCQILRSALARSRMAEGVRFELTRPFSLPVFKTGAINRSATPPGEVVRAYFRISQAMGKVDRAVSLGGMWVGLRRLALC
jgi:hypothetical protein